jgi:hypothetical protein
MRVYGNGDLATETTQVTISELSAQIRALNDTMLYFAAAILDRMPTLDTAHRANVNVVTGNVAVTGTATVSGSLTTVSTVTTCSAVTNLNNMAGGNTALIPYQLGAGSFHLYNGINVTA